MHAGICETDSGIFHCGWEKGQRLIRYKGPQIRGVSFEAQEDNGIT